MCLRSSGRDRFGTMLDKRADCQRTTQWRESLHLQLFKECGMSISEPDGRNVGLVNIITRRTR